MTPQAAQQIYERRKIKPFANKEEITRAVPVNLAPATLTSLSTEQTGVYTLTASAHRENSKVVRVIRAVILLDPREAAGYRVVSIPSTESGDMDLDALKRELNDEVAGIMLTCPQHLRPVRSAHQRDLRLGPQRGRPRLL
jgi:hypothetical protein